MQDEHFLVGIAPGNDRCDCGFWGPISFNMLDDIIVDVTYVLCFFPFASITLFSNLYVQLSEVANCETCFFFNDKEGVFTCFLALIF